MAAVAFYMRIDQSLKDELLRLSKESNLSLTQVAEIVIARGLGMDGKASVNRVNDLIAERFGIVDGKDS